jgi:hypothetical protein
MSPSRKIPSTQRVNARKAFVSFGLVCALAVGAATAQISAPNDTGIDNSGNYARERAACMNGATQQAQDTCLKEAENAAAEKRKGELASPQQPQLAANALQRCEALGGEEHAACTARVLGYGNASGSVAGGGVIRQVETVVVPPGESSVTIEPKTPNPVLIVPRPQ